MTAVNPRAAARATFLIFGLNGMVFASWAARIPAVTATLGLSSGEMGALLLVTAVGSLISLPLSGTVVARIGTAHAVRAGGLLAAVGGVSIALSLLAVSVPGVAAGLFLFGAGVGLWDVSQNLEGAEVERRLRRTVMPQFHAGFSGGAFVGAMIGAGLAKLDVGLPVHLLAIAGIVVVLVLVAPRYFLPDRPHAPAAGSPQPRGATAWREGRTLLIGLVVLGAALTEGAANDWLAKATVDGLHATQAVGALMFAVFVASMTAFRFVGARFIDRYGRVLVLRASLGAALAGLVAFVLVPNVWLAAVGAVLWGAGAALGFPVGMSAAADDPARAAARVSVVSTIGYTAFLAGPPVLGFIGDHVGVRNALLAVGVVIVASLVTIPAARPLPVPEPAVHSD
ncbi:MFS transporter [Paenarthrobacter sp. DKR-5]|uniref:MFS transporter n=1 Tax=Paenarthrobacter sp. DKR-5 TaxID=2835535 RepID=UPI001BDC6975|nr:MFS transporter [Paenarthrobacter sp. DKR-5]MBT1004231.1 MFS transporter [Paenarthrobacter sp. DKR-5]